MARTIARLRAAASGAAGGALVVAALAATTPTASAAVVEDCTQWGTTEMQGGEYIYQQNEWNSETTQCATIDTTAGSWELTQADMDAATDGAPGTYPSVFKGCHWGTCTSANTNMPIQVSELAGATSSWSTSVVDAGAYNVAYDLWVNSTPTTDGQPDGTEVMIWLDHHGDVQPIGSPVETVSIAGHTWEIWRGQADSWNVISFVQQNGNGSIDGLNVKALIDEGVERGAIDPSHYLITAEAGFEIWQGGQGLATDSFSFTATADGGGNGDDDTQPPSVPSNLAVTGTTDSSVSLSWDASSDNVGVTSYEVYRDGSLVETVSSTSVTDAGLDAETSYAYSVAAVDAAGNSSGASDPVTATTRAGDGGGDAGCVVEYGVQDDWGSGFVAEVTVTNTGETPIEGWTVEWTWPGSQEVTRAWNAQVSQSGQSVTAADAGWNGSLEPEASASFGLQGTYSGTNAAPEPSCSTG